MKAKKKYLTLNKQSRDALWEKLAMDFRIGAGTGALWMISRVGRARARETFRNACVRWVLTACGGVCDAFVVICWPYIRRARKESFPAEGNHVEEHMGPRGGCLRWQNREALLDISQRKLFDRVITFSFVSLGGRRKKKMAFTCRVNKTDITQLCVKTEKNLESENST